MEITQKDEVVRFYGKSDEKGRISDLMLLVGGDENTLINIHGLFDPKDLSKIAGTLHADLNSSK